LNHAAAFSGEYGKRLTATTAEIPISWGFSDWRNQQPDHWNDWSRIRVRNRTANRQPHAPSAS